MLTAAQLADLFAREVMAGRGQWTIAAEEAQRIIAGLIPPVS